MIRNDESHQQAAELASSPELLGAWGGSVVETQLILAMVESGLLTKFLLKKLSRNRGADVGILDAMLATGTTTEDNIATRLANHFHLPYRKLEPAALDHSLSKYLDRFTARLHTCVPIELLAGQLTLACNNPLDFAPASKIETACNLSVKTVISTRKQINAAIDSLYGSRHQAAGDSPLDVIRILHVEDESIDRKLMTVLCRKLSFATELSSAAHGQEALTMLTPLPHLILLDLRMPVMDGFEFLTQLRSNLDTAFVPVAVLTSSPPEESQHIVMELGADEYLSKPIKAAEFEDRIGGVLRRIYGL